MDLRISFLRASYERIWPDLVSFSAAYDARTLSVIAVHEPANEVVIDDIQSIISEMIADYPNLDLDDQIIEVASRDEADMIPMLEVRLYLKPRLV